MEINLFNFLSLIGSFRQIIFSRKLLISSKNENLFALKFATLFLLNFKISSVSIISPLFFLILCLCDAPFLLESSAGNLFISLIPLGNKIFNVLIRSILFLISISLISALTFIFLLVFSFACLCCSFAGYYDLGI